MRAARLHAVGGPQILQVVEVPVPEPRENEVLVRVRAAALNHRDVYITQGLYPRIALPVTLGSDGAGEIAALGSVFAGLAVGDEVVIDPMLDWGEDPQVWDPERSSILGMPSDGTWAQYVTVPAVNVFPKPAALSMNEAAALPLAGLTAYRALFTRGALQSNERVLVTGIGGGVQTFALLFAKQAGAQVVVTSSSDAKLQRARELGAEAGVNYASSPQWAKELRASGPFDLIVDSSGGDTLRAALDLVRPGGRVVIYGGTHGEATIKLFPLFWKHVTILGTSMGSPHDFNRMLQLFVAGLHPVLDRAFALDDVVAAAERLEAGLQLGKIVLTID